MRIGELAKRGGSNIETVRFYEREGLLEAPARDPNGYRRYTAVHLVQLNFVRHCRSLGMGLTEIRALRRFQTTPELACQDVNDLIDSQIDRIQQQIQSLRSLERQLHALRDTCHANRKTSECGIMRNLEQAAEGDGCPCHSFNRTA